MNILITRHDKIGDFVTMLPVCKVLHEQTNYKIVMLVSKVNVKLAQNLNFIDDVIEYTEDKKALLETIKDYDFDISISGYIDTTLGLILWRAKIPTRIAPATKIAQFFFNKRIKQRRSEVKMREFEYNLQLLNALDLNLDLNFKRPLLQLTPPDTHEKHERYNFIILHTGCGGSSDGNLRLDDYLKLAKKASEFTKVIFSFGPDDIESQKYIKTHSNFKSNIKDDFKSLVEFTEFIAKAKLFVSTSTGPMHLAGMTNTPTLSFFGSNLFASAKRWGTISDEELQHNFNVEENYGQETYNKIEEKLIEIITG